MRAPLLLLEKSPMRAPVRTLVEASSFAESVRRLLGAQRVAWLHWGPGLAVAVDEDAVERGRAPNVTLGSVDRRGRAAEPLEVSGPLLVCGYDGQHLVSLRVDDVEDVSRLLVLGESLSRAVLWPSGSTH